VSVLLEMLSSRRNNVAVVGSSSAAWDRRGSDVSGRVTLLGYDDDDDDDARLTPMTARYRQQLVRALDSLHPQGGSDHRFSYFTVPLSS